MKILVKLKLGVKYGNLSVCAKESFAISFASYWEAKKLLFGNKKLYH